mmetsp:Transcript_25170/g.28994  ORF Transcript_25170/g.28994 Transcript_25170/m.28994 type:complete len:103 (+) Transcript_25170:466-774(+)
MNYVALSLGPIYGDFMNDFEIFRARNKLCHELMQIQTVSDVLQSIGPQILYLNRRVHRSEIAERISNLSTEHMKQLCKTWLSDDKVSVTNWGPINTLEITLD